MVSGRVGQDLNNSRRGPCQARSRRFRTYILTFWTTAKKPSKPAYQWPTPHRAAYCRRTRPTVTRTTRRELGRQAAVEARAQRPLIGPTQRLAAANPLALRARHPTTSRQIHRLWRLGARRTWGKTHLTAIRWRADKTRCRAQGGGAPAESVPMPCVSLVGWSFGRGDAAS